MARQNYYDVVSDARDQANQILKEAKEEFHRLRQESGELQQKLDLVNNQREALEKARDEIAKLREELIEKLEKVSHLTREEAESEILKQVDSQLEEEIAKKIRAACEKAKQEADQKSREVLVDVMKHGAVNATAEYTISTVKLENEDAKGQIIGQGGKNIRTFERETGVDVDLDETPGEVRLSSFDPIRREIARVSLIQLIKDGRIQPARIEEIIAKTKSEIEKLIFEAGKKLAEDCGTYNLPNEILSVLGRFKYRFSYGQNMIIHTLEETKIGVAIAHELKADVETVRLGCLLHDIGKVVTNEEGSHVELGVRLAKKYDIPEKVIRCIGEHHEDEQFSSVESVIVWIADAISGSRPGARYEDYQEYARRLKKLEAIAQEFPGVKEAFAIQAGREVRVITRPEEITDAAVTRLAHDIAQKVQKEMTYPGTVTVNVIREVRAQDVAR